MRVEYRFVFVPRYEGCPSEDACAVHSQEGEPFFAAVVDGHGAEVDRNNIKILKSHQVADFAAEVAVGLRDRFTARPEPVHAHGNFSAVTTSLEPWRKRVSLKPGAGLRFVGAVASCVTFLDETFYLSQVGDGRFYVSMDRGVGYRRLSDDHVYSNRAERRRLAGALAQKRFALDQRMSGNGTITYLKIVTSDKSHTLRLEPTRTFGDWEFADLLPSIPECRAFPLSQVGEHELFALCVDGGNQIVEQVMRELRGRAWVTPWDEIELLTTSRCIDPDDDIMIIYFRVVP